MEFYMKNYLLKLLTFFLMLIMTATVSGSDLYLGLYGGGTLSSSTNKATEGANKKNTDLGSVGETLGLSIAYEVMNDNQLVLEIEAFGAWHGYDAIQDSQLGAISLNTKVRMKHSLGTALKIGYQLNQALVFTKVGYINSRFEHSSDYAGGARLGVDSQKSPGLLLGLGIDLKLTERVSVGLSYDYALYRSQSYTYSPFSTGTTTVTNVFKARMHFVNVGIKYKI